VAGPLTPKLRVAPYMLPASSNTGAPVGAVPVKPPGNE
jgi:hypothetical protein